MNLEIVTPRGPALSRDDVDEVTAPGVLGELGVLPGHVPFLTGLKAGVLRWRARGGRGTLAVGAGFLEVGAGERVVVLCDAAMAAEEVDVAEARRAAEEADARLRSAADADRAAFAAARAWAQARLDAAAGGPGAGG